MPFTETSSMFTSSQLAPSICPLRQRQQNYTWDHSYVYTSETTLMPSRSSSSSSLTYQDHPTTTTTTTTTPPPTQRQATLLSRINAVNRRAAIVSANLAHLTAVIKPLETSKLETLSEDQVNDMWDEGIALYKAMQPFQEQMQDMIELLNELLMSRERKVRRSGGGKGDGRRRRGELEV